MILSLKHRTQAYSDAEVVVKLQQRDKTAEEWFYHMLNRYFSEHFSEVFFDKDKKQEIFQSAVLKLWIEIENHRIRVDKGCVQRQQRDGIYRPLSCSLTTFLMAFAKTEYRELMRSTKEDYYAELFDNNGSVEPIAFDNQKEEEELRNRIVDECIGQMSPRCIEILTMFYYQGMTLDQIMSARNDKNTSKNGLKVAKSKCMSTLRGHIEIAFTKFHLN